jgi:serine/threonine protein kinase/tetratricopeptide (TPR) repeat protein
MGAGSGRGAAAAAAGPPPLEEIQRRIGEQRFVLRRTLGQGGMGTVYEALDRTRNEALALKTLRRFEPALLTLFKKEFRALADVSHPNLVALYELVQTNEIWFFTMELVHGVDFLAYVQPASSIRDPAALPSTLLTGDPLGIDRTLAEPDDVDTIASRQLVRGAGTDPQDSTFTRPTRREPLDGERLRGVLRQLAEAIDALHASGHLHGDIKPSNVLVTPEGRVVVLDFGVITELSGRREGLDALGITGTPAFMGPEQFVRGVPPSPSSDWYALGTILYKALTGRLPFQGGVETLARVKRDHDPLPVQVLRADAPADLATLCMSLLAREPAARPTGAEILRHLGSTAAVALGTSASDVAEHAGGLGADVPVGREAELGALTESLASADAGRAVSVLVSGRSGIGKSTVVRHFLAPLASRGDVLVLFGRCYERESMPYKALDNLIDSACRHMLTLRPAEIAALLPSDTAALARAFPVLLQIEAVAERADDLGSDRSPSQLRRRAFAACRELFGNLSRRRTLVLYIDDLQWGDADSIPLLADLMLQRDGRSMMLASYRSEDVPSSAALRLLFQTLGGEDQLDESVRRIEIGPLPEAALVGLARRLLAAEAGGGSEGTMADGIEAERDRRRASDELARRIATEAKGSPYFVHEMVRYAASLGGAVRGDTAMSLESVILARVGALTVGARALLNVVAMSAWRVTQGIAQAASGLDGAQRPLLELRAGLFVRTSGIASEDSIETYHDKVREAVVSTLSDEEQRAIHRRIAESLDAVATDSDEHAYALAHHFFHARVAAQAARTVSLNRLAGDRAAKSLAHAQACLYYGQAELVASCGGFALVATFYARLGDASARAGRMDAATSALSTALRTSTDAVERATLRLALSKIRLGQLDSRASRDEAVRALGELDVAAPRLTALRMPRMLMKLRRALQVIGHHEPRESVDPATRARARALVGIYDQLGYAEYFQLNNFAMVLSLLDGLEHAVLLGPSSELADWFALASTISAILKRSDWSEQAHAQAERIAADTHDPLAIARVALYRGLALNFLGETRRAQVHMSTVLEERGHLLENQDFFNGTGDLAWNLMMRGYAAESWAIIQKGHRRAALTTEDTRAVEGHTYRCYAGPDLAILGRPREGAEHLARYREVLDAAPDDVLRRSMFFAQRLLFLVESDRADDELAEGLDAWTALGHSRPERLPQTVKHAYVAYADGRLRQLARSAPHQRHARVRLAERALRDLGRAASHPTLVGHHLGLTGTFERMMGRYARARAALGRAVPIAEQVDAPWITFRIERERAALALAVGRPGEAREQADAARALARAHGWVTRAARLEALLAARDFSVVA